MSDRLVEIPVCLPDDLQLLDGLKLDERGARQAWIDVLRQTHRRGELFNLMFHPESFDQCGPALEAVLREARAFGPLLALAGGRTRSALCVTGDLDALSLTDYVARVLAL